MGDDVPAIQNENETTQPLPAVDPAAAAGTASATAPKPGWRMVAVPVVAALIVGVGAGYALNDITGDDGSSAPGVRGFPTLSNGSGFGGQGQNGQGQNGQGQNGQDFRGGPPQGGFGGVEGEERIQGTVTGTTASSVTVKSSGGGTATYAVNSTSQIVANGQLGSLSDVKVGDTVFLHVIPRSSGDATGDKVVERLFVGTMPQGGPGYGLPGGDGQQGGSGTGGTQTF